MKKKDLLHLFLKGCYKSIILSYSETPVQYNEIFNLDNKKAIIDFKKFINKIYAEARKRKGY